VRARGGSADHPRPAPAVAGSAHLSFVYNCGSGALRASTLRKVISARRWEEVPGEFAKWRTGGGRVLAGLVRRRKAEADLFMRGVRLQAEHSYGEGAWTALLAARRALRSIGKSCV
jgi:hypothetical protein